MSTTFGQAYGPITADKVISAHPGTLHGFLLSSVAATATIQFFDDTTTTNPANPITGVITPGALTVPTFIPFAVQLNNGLVVKIGVAAANLTATGRFSS